MQKDDYNHKLQQMIDEVIKNGIYTPTEDNTLNNLRKFQDFLRRNFIDKSERYEDMRFNLLYLINLNAYMLQLEHINLIR